ncbi:glucose 1-dehydrogenase [Archaeoglobus sp.]|uniref:SDR family NAD(P)-dependent oxidoreductase n=1 Tax=Archaeoglobus sp. TaxID=1872626 RepID=UPI0025B8A2CD|nr:glucose 1-dehydrogenase [Archaeoglobus sp.]
MVKEVFESVEDYQKSLEERVQSGSMGYRKMFDLTGKVAVVTGATGGLGGPIALGLADFGCDVVVVGRRVEVLEKLKTSIEKLGRKALAIKCDITKEEDVVNLVNKTVEEFGRIDILVNCAGINIPKPAEEYPLEDWNKVMDANVTGVFLVCREVGKVMIKQNGGKIINVSSVRSEYGLPRNYIAYCASKAAVNLITKQLACEWAKYNILVNAIAPTVIATPLTAHIMKDPELSRTMKSRILLGRWGYPDDLIGAVIFFASDASNFVTGQILFIDGGVTSWA